MSRRLIVATALATVSLWAAPVGAQGAYPNKPISIVVSYPPGGDTDAIARLFAERLSQRLKQTVVVENKPGAGGVLGNTFVGRAPADGYTLLFTPNPFTTAPIVMKLAAANSYDVLNGFEPIIKTATQPLLLVAHPGTGFKTFGDVVKAVKAGAKVNYGSPGSGSPMHIVAEQLNNVAEIKVTHVPYRGVGPLVVDAVAGHVQLAWVTLGAVSQYINQGKLVPIAFADAKRSPLAPQIPTLVEQGYKEVVVGAWNGFFAPKGTNEATVKLLNEHFNEILKSKEVVERLANFGALPSGGAPGELARTNAKEYEVMGRLIKDLNINAD